MSGVSGRVTRARAAAAAFLSSSCAPPTATRIVCDYENIPDTVFHMLVTKYDIIELGRGRVWGLWGVLAGPPRRTEGTRGAVLGGLP